MNVPVLNASGCLDALTAPEVARSLDAFVTKTVTPLRREGNPPPRFAETDRGMLNSIGLQNPGIDAFVTDVLPRLGDLGVPIWVSVGGFSADDYASVCERLDRCAAVEVIELNLSCPNVEEAPETAAELVHGARAVTSKPLYAKLSPATQDIAETARAVVSAGADGLSLVNTIRGLDTRPADAHADTRARGRRLLRTGARAGRAGVCLGVCAGGRSSDRRDGRRVEWIRRGRARRGRCERSRARNDSVFGPGSTGQSAEGDGGRGESPGSRIRGRHSGYRARYRGRRVFVS